MLGYKPNKVIWERVNAAIMGENAAEVIVTFIGGITGMLLQSGACESVAQARAHLAAMLISPDTGERVGSLLPLLQAELARLDDGKWVQ
jgi:hypothetical protein